MDNVPSRNRLLANVANVTGVTDPNILNMLQTNSRASEGIIDASSSIGFDKIKNMTFSKEQRELALKSTFGTKGTTVIHNKNGKLITKTDRNLGTFKPYGEAAVIWTQLDIDGSVFNIGYNSNTRDKKKHSDIITSMCEKLDKLDFFSSDAPYKGGGLAISLVSKDKEITIKDIEKIVIALESN